MLRIVPHTVPRVGRSYEHFPDEFELHLLPDQVDLSKAGSSPRDGALGRSTSRDERMVKGTGKTQRRQEAPCRTGRDGALGSRTFQDERMIKVRFSYAPTLCRWA